MLGHSPDANALWIAFMEFMLLPLPEGDLAVGLFVRENTCVEVRCATAEDAAVLRGALPLAWATLPVVVTVREPSYQDMLDAEIYATFCAG